MKAWILVVLVVLFVVVVPAVRAQTPRHAWMVWYEQIGSNQKAYKVSVDGFCFVVFESTIFGNGIGVSSNQIDCH